MGFLKNYLKGTLRNGMDRMARQHRSEMTTEELEEAYEKCKNSECFDRASERYREELWKRGICHPRDRRY